MKNVVSRVRGGLSRAAVRGLAVASVLGVVSMGAQATPPTPTTAVALAQAINFSDANSAQLIAAAALITLMVTAAGAMIVISRIKKAKSA